MSYNARTFGDYTAVHTSDLTSEVWDMGTRKRLKQYSGETAWMDAERDAQDWDTADRNA